MSHRKRLLRITTVGLSLIIPLALAGCGEPDDNWPNRDLDDKFPPWRETTLASGWGLEMDFPARTGEAIDYDWFIMEREKIGFQIHWHTQEGRDPRGLEGEFYEHTGAYIATSDDTHSIVWMNPNDEDLTLWIKMQGELCEERDGEPVCARELRL